MLILELLCVSVFGGFLNRIRGGMWTTQITAWLAKWVGPTLAPKIWSDNVAGRPIVSVGLALVAFWSGVPALWSVLLALLFWIGCTCGLFESIGMGYAPGPSFWPCWIGLIAYGSGRVLLAIPVLWYLGLPFLPLALTALWISPLYALGWWITADLLKGKSPYVGSQFGEWFYGAALGIAMFLIRFHFGAF